MVLLAIFGSPRENGNTDLMMEAFLEGAVSAEPGLLVERIRVRDLAVSGCLGCGYCDSEGVCVQKDDMEKIYPLFDNADRIVIACPIYFYGFPGQLKLLIDRSQATFMRNLQRKTEKPRPGPARKGFLLSAGATRGKRLFDCAILTARYFFDALGIGRFGQLCFRQIDEKGAIHRHPTALEDCRKAGREFVL